MGWFDWFTGKKEEVPTTGTTATPPSTNASLSGGPYGGKKTRRAKKGGKKSKKSKKTGKNKH
jgi:hypothetical protein